MGAVQPVDAVTNLPAIRTMADRYDLSADHFAFTFRSVAMPAGHSDAEFVSCCLVAKEHGLNPLTKEIYFMKTKAGTIQPIVSVDGWVRKCNEHPQFDGMEFKDEHNDKGEPVATTCIIYRKDREHPTIVTEYMDECKANGGLAWKTSPRRMLRHRALTQAARYAFGFAGVMDRDEFDQWQGGEQAQRQSATVRKLRPVDDIPDIPDEAPPAAEDSPIADVDGYLAKLREERGYCQSVDDLDELREANADLIARLPKAQQDAANAILSEDVE